MIPNLDKEIKSHVVDKERKNEMLLVAKEAKKEIKSFEKIIKNQLKEIEKLGKLKTTSSTGLFDIYTIFNNVINRAHLKKASVARAYF